MKKKIIYHKVKTKMKIIKTCKLRILNNKLILQSINTNPSINKDNTKKTKMVMIIIVNSINHQKMMDRFQM